MLRMATLEDLPTQSIQDMSPDEAIEYLRQIRLSRRVKKTSTVSEPTQKKRTASKAIPKVNAKEAEELLKLLGGS